MLQKIAQYSEQKLKGISEVFNNGLQVDVMKYADAKGKAGKSCMDLSSATGASEVTVQLAKKWLKC